MNLGPKGLEILGTDEMLVTVWLPLEFLSSKDTGPDLERPSKGRYLGFPRGRASFAVWGKPNPTNPGQVQPFWPMELL